MPVFYSPSVVEVSVQIHCQYHINLCSLGKVLPHAVDERDLQKLLEQPCTAPKFRKNLDHLWLRMTMSMQAVAGQGDDPGACLSQSGIYASESAVVYLSPLQLEDVTAELEAMEAGFGVEVAAWTLSEKLNRASRANNWMPVPRR